MIADVESGPASAGPLRPIQQNQVTALSNPHLSSDSLAYSLRGAALALVQVREGTALPQALTEVFQHLNPAAQGRGAIQDIAYRTLRRRGRAEALLAILASRPPAPALLHELLCCALALISDPAGEPAPYESFTVVDQAVTAAAADPRTAPAKSMVNAVLRRFLRERETLLKQVLNQPEAQWNYPAWWIKAARTAYPNDWQAILRAGNGVPPLTLRVNRRKSAMDDYLRLLSASGIAATRVGPHAVRLEQPVPVGRIPGFAEGLVSVQDAAAQLAAPLLDVHDGMRVLDACAAPGGKTGHILECADVELLALDAEPKRLARIDENLKRLQLEARIEAGDASTKDWWDGRPFDRILADVPCTASGIVRRHPDIRWLRRESDAARLAALSARILDNLWPMLRPDGKLLFVTCSVWPKESEQQAAAFAARTGALRLPAPGQLLPTVAPHAGEDHDGLFYALFQKTPV
jgi:16S rRNA (cytosine967-C5)-methyltransferase